MMDYTIKTIKDLCLKITDGSHFSPTHVENGEYYMYSVKDMLYNGFDNSNCKLIDFETFQNLSKSDCRPLCNDILIAKDGSYLKYVFKVKKDLNACILSSIAILRPNIKIISPDYFVYVLRTNSMKRAMANYVSGSALPRIILSDFKKMKVKMVENIDTQRKIAEVLSTYDDLIENNNKRIELLENMAQELYKEWFVRFRFPGHKTAKFENGIPEGWEVKRIISFGEVETGKTPSTEKSENYGNEIMFIKTPDIHGNIFIIETEEMLSNIGHLTQPKKLIPANSIIVTCIGTGGLVTINAEPSHTNQQINSIKLYNQEYLEWLFYACKGLKDVIELYGATGTTMTNLSKGKFERLKILKPTNRLINEYHEKTKQIFSLIKTLMLNNKTLRTQRDLLLPRLMSGKLEV